MSFLTWSSKYSVGVKALDDQHVVFFGMLNELHAAMMKGQAQTIAGPLLRKLATYAKEHFSTEERLMESAKFPGLAHHHAEHQALIAKLTELMARYEKGDKSIFLPLLQFMRDWLSKHLLEEDKLYTNYLNEHGVR